MSEWLRPILGAALLLAGAAGLAYKVISGYQHASPDAFISVHDQNRVAAASAAEKPTPTATVPVEVAAPAQDGALASKDAALASKDAAPAAQAAASPAPSAATAPQTAPTTAAAPPAASGNNSAIASSAASNVALHAEALDDPACVPINAEQAEIQGALKKQYSPEQGRFMQRRLRELAEQSGKFKCSE
jgi:hypothetical protein